MVMASNRGPFEFVRTVDGCLERRASGGGLAAILSAATEGVDCCWVAAAVSDADRAATRPAGPAGAVTPLPGDAGVTQLAWLAFDPTTYRLFYQDLSVRLLWFLHHHMATPVLTAQPAALHRAWLAYRQVNRRFAQECARRAAPGGQVMVHDYHLFLAPRLLRRLRPDLEIAHLTACPWASPPYLARLPGPLARAVLDGMLGADLVAFLADRWAQNFLDCCAAAGYPVCRDKRTVLARGGRPVRVRAFPVGVPDRALRALLGTAQAARYRDEVLAAAAGRRIVVRIDRMEPTKNIVRGVLAYRRFLERVPSARGAVVHYILAYGSRQEIAEYRGYEAVVRQVVAEVNRVYGNPGWRPVVLETRNDRVRGLVAAALADVLVVNPLRDGMNLVAKEGPVVSEKALALILSTEAGAAPDLAGGATLVDPTDVAQLADELGRALRLPMAERLRRLARLRAGATAQPPSEWLAGIRRDLAAAAGACSPVDHPVPRARPPMPAAAGGTGGSHHDGPGGHLRLG
ncbi:MAG TPA: trehalose-6-phosphate synthase [Micromonosporaceae bacterium]|nr:trehalose-6-phosphate synthase [Micromonosporaceae bacterium]